MNQEEFISWIKNNSKWIITKFENLEDYKNNNVDLKAGDIILSSKWWSKSEDQELRIVLIDSINIYDYGSNEEWASYFMQTAKLKKSKTKPPNKKLILDASVGGQPYEDLKFTFLFEMVSHKEYVVGNISETIKKPFLNWNQETPWKKSSSDQ